MTDDDKSLGDDATLGGESPEQEVDAQSLGDQSTHGDHSQMDSVGDSSSLGDQLTFGSDESGEALDDGMEIVDLESRYTIERVLGKGGMGEVLLATDTRLERKVAIKRILGKAARSKTAVNRFLTEAKSVAAINHPNIVQIHDYGRDKEGPFLIMEYVAGESLLERCQQGAIALEESIDLIVQLCDGLAAAHDAHIVHRDVKPANILLTKNNIPKLTDFGLAKAETADTGMTMAGAVLGTLDFMPPEQRKDATQVDARSDLWSLAATLYQMVTGESPKVIRLKKVPAELQDVLDKALEDKKDDRYQDARAFKDALLASRSSTAEAELEEGDCPHCGTKNPTTRKFCRNPDCSESLEVPCLSCSSKIPMWEQVCDSCGTPQPDLLEQRRSQMASAQAEAESLLKRLDFDRAKRVAVTLRDEPDLRLMHLKGWAERFLGEIEKGREQQLARLAELMTEAVTHQQAHDYAAGLRTLGQVPEIVCNTPLPGHDQTVKDLRKKLQSDLDEIKRLDPLIRTRVKNRDLDGLLAEVEQLQRLQPSRENLQKLAQQLTARDSKLSATRDEALAEAKKRLSNQDYDGCLAQLNRIDVSLVDADVESLRATAEENLHQVNALRDAINLAVQNKQLDGLLPQVEQCLALQAGAEDLLKLRDQLVERESRNAASIAKVIQQAERMRDARRFDKAVTALGQISEELATQQSKDLLTECENLESLRSGAMQAMERARETGDFKNAVTTLTSYQDALSASGLVDPVVDRATAACQRKLEAQRKSEQAARRQKALMIKRGIGPAALVVVGVSVMIVLWVQSSMRSSAIATAIRQGRYTWVLARDPNNAEAKLGQAVQQGRWDDALAIDGDHATALIGRAKDRLSSASPDVLGAFADLKRAEDALGPDPSSNQQGASRSRVVSRSYLMALMAKQHWDNHIKVDGLKALAYATRAKKLTTEGKLSDAERDLKEAQFLIADNRMVDRSVSSSLAVRRWVGGMSAATARCVSSAKKELARAWLKLGEESLAAGRRDAGLSAAAKALAYDPSITMPQPITVASTEKAEEEEDKAAVAVAEKKNTTIKRKVDSFWGLGEMKEGEKDRTWVATIQGPAKVQSVKLVGNKGAGETLEEGKKGKDESDVLRTKWIFRQNKFDVFIFDSGEITIEKTGLKTFRDEKLELLVTFEEGGPDPQTIRLTPLARMPSVATVIPTFFKANNKVDTPDLTGAKKPKTLTFDEDAADFLQSQFEELNPGQGYSLQAPIRVSDTELTFRIQGNQQVCPHISGTVTINLDDGINVQMKYWPDMLNWYFTLLKDEDQRIEATDFDGSYPVPFARVKDNFAKKIENQQSKKAPIGHSARIFSGLHAAVENYHLQQQTEKQQWVNELAKIFTNDRVSRRKQMEAELIKLRTAIDNSKVKAWPDKLTSPNFTGHLQQLYFLAKSDKGDVILIRPMAKGTSDKVGAIEKYNEFIMANGR